MTIWEHLLVSGDTVCVCLRVVSLLNRASPDLFDLQHYAHHLQVLNGVSLCLLNNVDRRTDG
jgi:hypothetical protein